MLITETVKSLINQFTGDLNQLIETEAEAVRERISGALSPDGASFRLGVVKSLKLSKAPATIKIARKRKVVLCLRKNCKNVGAPIYGMVCVKHKDTPKATIKQLRAARAAK